MKKILFSILSLIGDRNYFVIFKTQEDRGLEIMMSVPKETYFQNNSKLLTWCILHNIHYYYDELWKYVSQILSRASVLESFCRGYRDFWFYVVIRLRPTYVSKDNVIHNYKEHSSDHRGQLYYLKWETWNETENRVKPSNEESKVLGIEMI